MVHGSVDDAFNLPFQHSFNGFFFHRLIAAYVYEVNDFMSVCDIKGTLKDSPSMRRGRYLVGDEANYS